MKSLTLFVAFVVLGCSSSIVVSQPVDSFVDTVNQARTKAEDAFVNPKDNLAELYKQLAAARLAIVRAETTIKREIERLKVESQSLNNKIVADAAILTNQTVPNVPQNTIATYNMEQTRQKL